MNATMQSSTSVSLPRRVARKDGEANDCGADAAESAVMRGGLQVSKVSELTNLADRRALAGGRTRWVGRGANAALNCDLHRARPVSGIRIDARRD